MVSYYETDRALVEYLLLHFGTPDLVLPYQFGPASALDFPARCVTECVLRAQLPKEARALDLGCAVGRSSFELARLCPRVVGIDYSVRLITAAQHLQQHGSMAFSYLEEGDLANSATAMEPAQIDSKRVSFEQRDADE